jgi:hypothetical protein
LTRLRHTVALLAALLVALALPATASADYRDVIRDCAEDGRLDRSYSDGDLRRAEDNLPTDVDEYTDCREVIRAAREGGGGAGGGPGGGAGGITPTDESLITDAGAVAASQEDLAALGDESNRYPGSNGPEIDVAGKPVKPGPNGVLDVATAANEVPPPLMAALIAVAALALAGGALLARRRWPQTLRAALRLFRR